MANEISGPAHTFAETLSMLFSTRLHPQEHREYTNAEMAQATGLSASLIGYLRSGERDNPTLDSIAKLAAFFEVKASVLIDSALDHTTFTSLQAQLRLFTALQRPGVKELALRADAANLTPAGYDAVTAMLEHVARAEQSARDKPSRRDKNSENDSGRPR